MAIPVNKHRVVVQLIEIDPELAENYTKNDTSEISNLIAEIEVTDNLSLKCKMNDKPESYSMHFDCVGFSDEKHVENEISLLMSNLVRETSSSCVMHFTPLRQLPLQFLSSLLVQEIDKKLVPMFCTLNCIYLEYCDLRKNTVINMIGRQSSDDQMYEQNEQLQQQQQPSSSNNQRGKRRLCMKTFITTLELFKWLRTEFVRLWSRGQGHDCFDIKFVYLDSRSRLHRVKLMLYQIYVNKLDTIMKSDMCKFLQNNGNFRRQYSSILTDCLSQYFEPGKEIPTLLLFDVPIVRGGVLILNDMLTLAEAAYFGVQSSKMTEQDMDLLSLDLSLLPSSNSKAPLPKCSSCTKNFSKPQATKQPLAESLSLKDLNTLSYWYCKIDEKFSEVLCAMENYYQNIYKNKTEKIYSELKSIVSFSKSLQQIKRGNLSNTVYTSRPKQAMVCYKDAINAFRALVKDVERSSYSAILKVYLRTKNYELLRHVLHFKEVQLENCQSNLIAAINQEISALHEINKK